MRLLFKQRFFSWFDSYDIYDEDGNTVFTVEGKLAWGHCLHILNAMGDHIGTVQQRVLTSSRSLSFISASCITAASARNSRSSPRASPLSAATGR